VSVIAQILGLSVDMWIHVILMAIILILLGVILAGRGGILKRKRLESEVRDLRAKIRELEGAGFAGEEAELKRPSDLFGFVRDLETLRSAIAGSKLCQQRLVKRYKLKPSSQLLKRVLSRARLEPSVKEKLADEFLVGAVGREMLNSFNRGASIERAAAEVGIPLVVAKGQVRRLQVLGYLDNRLKPTEQGWRALR
jgi:hypothetical protein